MRRAFGLEVQVRAGGQSPLLLASACLCCRGVLSRGPKACRHRLPYPLPCPASRTAPVPNVQAAARACLAPAPPAAATNLMPWTTSWGWGTCCLRSASWPGSPSGPMRASEAGEEGFTVGSVSRRQAMMPAWPRAFVEAREVRCWVGGCVLQVEFMRGRPSLHHNAFSSAAASSCPGCSSRSSPPASSCSRPRLAPRPHATCTACSRMQKRRQRRKTTGRQRRRRHPPACRCRPRAAACTPGWWAGAC